MKSILCIEDNAEVRILVEASLDPLRVVSVGTIAEGRTTLEREPFQLIVLDLELPDGDGLKFLTELNSKASPHHQTPIFILTGKTETANKVIAFSLGVEDFITKPFDPVEFRARVNAKLRKQDQLQDSREIIKLKDLTIHLARQRVYFTTGSQQEEISLTSLEFKLLSTFAHSPERVFSRDQLLDQVWGSATHITDRTVDTHVGHLRKKIAAASVRIETVINEGYRLKV